MHVQATFYIQITLKNPETLALEQNLHEIMKEIKKGKQENPNLSRRIVFSKIVEERTNGVLIIKLNLSVCDSMTDEFKIKITDELFLLVKTEIESFVRTKLNWCLNFKQEDLIIEKIPYVSSELQMQQQEALRQQQKALRQLKIQQALELQALSQKHEQEIACLEAQFASGSN